MVTWWMISAVCLVSSSVEKSSFVFQNDHEALILPFSVCRRAPDDLLCCQQQILPGSADASRFFIVFSEC
jgi:hypothetical protein